MYARPPRPLSLCETVCAADKRRNPATSVHVRLHHCSTWLTAQGCHRGSSSPLPAHVPSRLDDLRLPVGSPSSPPLTPISPLLNEKGVVIHVCRPLSVHVCARPHTFRYTRTHVNGRYLHMTWTVQSSENIVTFALSADQATHRVYKRRRSFDSLQSVGRRSWTISKYWWEVQGWIAHRKCGLLLERGRTWTISESEWTSNSSWLWVSESLA